MIIALIRGLEQREGDRAKSVLISVRFTWLLPSATIFVSLYGNI